MKYRIYLILKVLGGAVLILSLCLNYVFYKADIEYWLAYRRIIKIESTPSPILNSITEFHNELKRGSLEYLKNGKRLELPEYTDINLRQRYLNSINKNESQVMKLVYADNDGYLFYSLLVDAIHSKDSMEIDYLKSFFDTQTLDLPIIYRAQAMYGLISITLYKYCRETKYKVYADNIYDWLKKDDTEFGILYIPKLQSNFVDVLGVIIPFLAEYAKTFRVEAAEKMALRQVELYTKYGCDKETGMPSFTYSLKSPHLKTGMMNWGRGICWYVIGLPYLDINKLTTETQASIERLNKTLTDIWVQSHRFNHFVCDLEQIIDLSAELPIVWYLNQMRCINLSNDDILVYSQYMHDGIMYHCSNGNSGAIKYGVAHGPSMLAQAFMLRLTRRTNNGN